MPLWGHCGRHEYVKTPTALADFLIEIYADEDARLSSFETRIRLAFSNRLSAMEMQVGRLESRIKGSFALKISALDKTLEILAARIVAADPRRILERGYALAVDEHGVVLKGAQGRRPGDKVSVMFADGTLDCNVNEVRL